MRIGIFTQENVVSAFKNKPVLSAREISEILFDDSPKKAKLAATKAFQLHNKGVLTRHKIGADVMYSLPNFEGCAEDYFIDKTGDNHCVPFPYGKKIIAERNAWMEKAMQFYEILNQNDIGAMLNIKGLRNERA